MPTIKVIDKTGSERTVDTGAAEILMLALREMPEGVQAICGGMMSCASCHVYIAEPWATRLPPPSSDEVAMLEALVHRKSCSRLSCQIALSTELDGLELSVAPDE